MELTICLCILHEPVAKFIHVASLQVFLSLCAVEVVVIHKVVARVIRRVDINHLYPVSS